MAQWVAEVENAWSQKRIALAPLLDVKGAFDRFNKQRLLLRMVEVGIAGNIVRWVNSFLSDRRTISETDRRTAVHSVVSGMFQCMEDRHSILQAISFVDDIGMVTECDVLEESTQRLERIALDAISWGPDNKVEFDVGKARTTLLTLVFSRSRKVLQETKNASVRIGH